MAQNLLEGICGPCCAMRLRKGYFLYRVTGLTVSFFQNGWIGLTATSLYIVDHLCTTYPSLPRLGVR